MRKLQIIWMQIAAMLSVVAIAFASSNPGRASEKYEKTLPLNSGGTVSLKNVNGDLKVTTWDRNEVRIQAEKYADDSDALPELKIDVDASKDMISIDTEYPRSHDDGRGHGISVNYVLTVPKSANLEKLSVVNGRIEVAGVSGNVEVSTVNGTIETRGLRGGCDLNTVNGKLDAEFASVRHGADIRLNTVNGTVVVRLPAKPDVDIKASTTTGHISNEFGLQDRDDSGHNSFVRIGDRLHGKLGEGSASVRLNTVNGSIKILKSVR